MPIHHHQALLIAAASALCGCQGAVKNAAPVALQVSTGQEPDFGPRPTLIHGDTMYLRLGCSDMAIGQRSRVAPVFQNIGVDDFTIVGVVSDTGDPEFSVDLPTPLVIVAGGPTAELGIYFAPFETTGLKAATIVLRTDSESLPFIELDLTGVASRFSLEFAPQTLDFGSVVAGTRAIQSLTVTNRSGIHALATVGPMLGTAPLLFTAEPSVGSKLQLSEWEATSMAVTFWPVAPSTTQAQAYFTLDLCGQGTGCHELVSVRGWAVATGLSVMPDQVDLGSVLPDATVTAQVTVSSVANLTIHLTADPSVLNDNPDGTKAPAGPWQLGAGAPMKGIAIPPGQSVQIPVVLHAPASGTASGELEISTDDPTHSSIVVQLKG